MHTIDYVINLILSIILIVGVYQFYFLCQRVAWVKPRVYQSKIDEAMPFWPSWIWIYSFLYYPAIVYLNLLAKNHQHFVYMAFSFMMLLVAQMFFFVIFPVATPDHWRELPESNAWAIRFLKFVQKFDKSSNCFPSMHTSVAMLTAMHALPQLGLWALLFPILIAISCVFTKQHYLIDLPAGAALGWGVFKLSMLVFGLIS